MIEVFKKISKKIKPYYAPDDWDSQIRLFYKFFGIPEKGFFYHRHKKFYYEMVNGLVDIYSVQEASKKFLDTVPYQSFRDSFLSKGQKVYL